MSLPPKETEDGEDEMSEDKDNGGKDKLIPPPKNHGKVTTASEKKEGRKKSLAPMFAEKLVSPSRKRATRTRQAEDRRSIEPGDLENRSENREEDEGQNSELDQEEEDSEKEAICSSWAKGRKALPVKAAADEQDDNDRDSEEEAKEEEPINKSPDKRKKEMAKQKAYRETKKQKLEAKPPVSFKLFAGNLNFTKTAAELKTGLSEFFAQNDLAVVGVRVGLSRKFGYVYFRSADDQEKALELNDIKVLGYEIKLKKPKRKETKKDGDAKTLLIKNLPDKVTQHELKEMFEDSFQIRLVNEDGRSKRIAYIEFKSQADAERAMEEKQGTEIHGLAILQDHTGEKFSGPGNRGRKSCPWIGKEY